MTMPAGKYYIGDLCYVMHDAWNEFCDITIDGHNCKDGEFQLKDGRRFATYGTAYGDGEYQANIGGSCGVDAGLIGCIRIEDIKDDTYSDISKLGIVVEFASPFETGETNGVIYFGHVRIDTAAVDEYDEDYSDEDYSDEDYSGDE